MTIGLSKKCISIAVLLILCPLTLMLAQMALSKPDLRLYICGNFKSTIEPCGCYPGQLGGLERLTAFMKARLGAEAMPTAYIHCGPTAVINDRQTEMKFELAMRALNECKCSAYAVGATDLLLGTDFLRKVETQSEFPFVASNLTDLKGEYVFKPYALVTATGQKGGRIRICVLSVIHPVFEQALRGFGNGIKVSKPAQSVTALLKELDGKADAFLVFYQGDHSDAEYLRKAIQDVGRKVVAIVRMGGKSAPGLKQPVRLAGSIVEPGQYGEYVVRLDAGAQEAGRPLEIRDCQVVKLDKNVSSDKVVSKWLADYRTAMSRERLVEKLLRWPAPFGDKYGGSKSCKECHEEQYAIWRKLKHSKAWETLKEKGVTGDPECVRCHSVGLREISGFVSEKKTPELTAVGCEACHGPMHRHVKNDLAYPGETLDSRASCNTCHTPEHSPAFDRNEYQKTIKHWDLEEKKEKGAAETTKKD